MQKMKIIVLEDQKGAVLPTIRAKLWQKSDARILR